MAAFANGLPARCPRKYTVCSRALKKRPKLGLGRFSTKVLARRFCLANDPARRGLIGVAANDPTRGGLIGIVTNDPA